MAKEKKNVDKKGKKQRKSKAPVKLHSKYEKKGDGVERKARFCPKCGPGFFMAQHKSRVACGKCRYTEFF